MSKVLMIEDTDENADWLKAMPVIREAMGTKEGKFVTIEGRSVFIRGPGQGGGSASSTTRTPVLFDIEQSYCDRELEFGAIISDSGQILSTMSSAEPSRIDLSSEDEALLKDAIFTHNHPSGSSLSPGDVWVAVDFDAQEIRAVGRGPFDNKRYAYSIKRPESGWPPDDVLSAEMKRAGSITIGKMFASISSGELTPDEANSLHWHTVWSTINERLPLGYTKEELT